LFSYAGVSRSAAIVIAYLMEEHDLNMFQSLSLLKSKRSVIFPNPGFQRQLLDFERKLMGQKKIMRDLKLQ
jgi:protein-tyrosine phosphatase